MIATAVDLERHAVKLQVLLLIIGTRGGMTTLLLLVGRSLSSPPSSVGVDLIVIVDASLLLLLLLLLLLMLTLMRRRCLPTTPPLVQRAMQIVGVYAAAELPPPVAVLVGLGEVGHPSTGISKIGLIMLQPLRRRPDAGVAPRGGWHYLTGGDLTPIRTHATTTVVAVIFSIVVIVIVEWQLARGRRRHRRGRPPSPPSLVVGVGRVHVFSRAADE